MAFLDILKGRKREEQKPERLQKGALKQPAFAKATADKFGKPARKRAEFKLTTETEKGKDSEIIEAKKTANNRESEEKQQTKTAQPYSAKAPQGKSLLAAEFLLRPHITEESTFLSKQNIYTFKVNPRANKITIKKAIKEMYGFEPIKVRIINVPLKRRHVRGKIGIKSGFKKALVYLKENDKIEFI